MSERAVRQVFARAHTSSSPCVIFFDKLDALVPRRDEALFESSSLVVNTLITELGGLDSWRGVLVLSATNRPDMLDPELCRPRRLDKLLYVDLPAPDGHAACPPRRPACIVRVVCSRAGGLIRGDGQGLARPKRGTPAPIWLRSCERPA